MEDYFRLIADKSNRVNFESLGATTLGHDFPLMQISAPENLAARRPDPGRQQPAREPARADRGGRQGARRQDDPGLLPRGRHALDRGRAGAGDPGHRLPPRDREVDRHQHDPQAAADRGGAGRQPGRLAPGHGLLQRDRRDVVHAHVSRPVPPLHRARRQPRLALLHPEGVRRPGSACSRSTGRWSSTSCTRRARPTRACGSRRGTTASAPRATRCRCRRRTRSAWTSSAGSTPGQEGRLHRQRLRHLGHVGHRQLRDLHGLGARAVRDREPARPRLPVHELGRQAARQPGAQHAQPPAVRQEHLDARAERRLPRVRGLARAELGRARAGALGARRALPGPAQRDQCDERAVGVRAAGGAARHVRGL